MIFHFGHMYIDNGPGGKYDPMPVTLQAFKKVFIAWDQALEDKGWGSVFLGNHDFSRMVSRFGDTKQYWKESAKLLATVLFTMRGTVYVYQGDEIGMTNVAFDGIDKYRDIETLNSWKEAEHNGQDMKEFMELVHMQSRDNARTPLHWDNTSNAGFTNGEPWIDINPNYVDINIQAQEHDKDSILSYYRQLIKFRKENPTLVYGQFEPLDIDNEQIFAYLRYDDSNTFLVIHNFSEHQIRWEYPIEEGYKLVLTNKANSEHVNYLSAWQTKVLKRLK